MRFRRFRSRADKTEVSISFVVGGEGNVGETERVDGEGAFAILSGWQTSIGEDGLVSTICVASIAALVVSISMSAANSLSRSMSSFPLSISRKSRPKRAMASFRAFLTSWVLVKIPAGLTNSLPEDARSSFPWLTSSRTEKLGNSGGEVFNSDCLASGS